MDARAKKLTVFGASDSEAEDLVAGGFDTPAKIRAASADDIATALDISSQDAATLKAIFTRGGLQ